MMSKWALIGIIAALWALTLVLACSDPAFLR